MNIVVFGAGAIGSLFGGILSKQNNVVLIGRKEHSDAINKKGLKIRGLTKLDAEISAFEKLEGIDIIPDLIVLSVKSYDTLEAAKKIKKIVREKTVVMSLQNGLDNVEKIKKFIDIKKIVVCITTNGAVFSKPGIITHTGVGKTTMGKIIDKDNNDIEKIVKIRNKL